ncbi:TRADD-N-associated membrane domain-containing protein [Anabaena azotica]|uniref:Cyanobacterial TRADD-N associated 2 transmembrane domain-containing protein n=1 Tax=Anabaena azotica FACHB-119 TaxID=947527 RepID=A0ABR8D2Q9_9NOST|nr:hypothetical protein [Anabaena azotica]MBD2501019.1 hypothetical protein [Anabaena azotica FACHB-119]
MKLNLFAKSQPQSLDVPPETKQKIIDELIRQAQLTCNLAVGVTAASAMMTLLGVGLLYLDKIPAASLTAGAGIMASIGSVQFAREAREELKQILE